MICSLKKNPLDSWGIIFVFASTFVFAPTFVFASTGWTEEPPHAASDPPTVIVEPAETRDALTNECRLELKPADLMEDTQVRMSVSIPASIREIELQPQSSSFDGQSFRVVIAGETIAEFPKTQSSTSNKMAPRSAFSSIKSTDGKSYYSSNPFYRPTNPAAEKSPDSMLELSRDLGSINNAPINDAPIKNAPINLIETIRRSKPKFASSKSSSGPPVVPWDPIPVRGGELDTNNPNKVVEIQPDVRESFLVLGLQPVDQGKQELASSDGQNVRFAREQTRRSISAADSAISLLTLDTTITHLPDFAPSPARNGQAQNLVENAHLIESSNPAIGSRRVNPRPSASASTLVLFDN